ncbi:hypothetical protein [Halomonas sp. GT]|uniref:hypothetical protein n=1 Tax=Halomonas sp. GT TaxID=1971364 RepID=UPI0018DD65C9|nr:hypothetical protein [Halomonas sp. GT]
MGDFDMKICVIGNSHVGALKRAWKSMPDRHSSATITFFASRGKSLEGLVADGGKLIPETEALKKSLEFTSGGKQLIDPDEYDIFLVYGLSARGLFISPKRHYSFAVLKQAAFDHVDGTLSFNLVRKIRELTEKTVFVGHNPLGAFRGVEFKVVEPEAYLFGLEVANDFVYSSIDSELVAQPSYTIVSGRFTHPSFSKGSKRLSIGDKFDDETHPENDYGHMNDEFGAAWLTSFLDNYCKL